MKHGGQLKVFTPIQFCWLTVQFWNKDLLMEALLCANSMVLIKQSHIWGISWKIYTFIYIHLYMDTSTEYSQIYWPLHQQKIKLIDKESRNWKKLHRGHLQNCGYIILNIRSICWITALRKKMFPFIWKYLSYRNEIKRELGFRTVMPTDY